MNARQLATFVNGWLLGHGGDYASALNQARSLVLVDKRGREFWKKVVKALSDQQQREREARKNPPRITPLRVKKFRSAKGHLVSGNVVAVAYVNIDSVSQQPYEHIFAGTGVELWALADGALLIRHPSERLWDDFVMPDEE